MADPIDVAAVLAELLTGADPHVAARALAAGVRQGHAGLDVDGWRTFAVLVSGTDSWSFGRALAKGGRLLTDEESIAALLLSQEMTAGRGDVLDTAIGDARPFLAAALVAHRGRSGLVLAPGLDDRLPLLELAADVARVQPGARLVVQAAVLATDALNLCGLFGSAAGEGGAVLLDENLGDDGLAEAWAHELAHALDVRLPFVPPTGAEAFAETLGPLLLDAAPLSVVEAAPLIRTAAAQTRLRRPTWPVHGDLPGLLAYVVDEVKLEPELTVVAADVALER